MREALPPAPSGGGGDAVSRSEVIFNTSDGISELPRSPVWAMDAGIAFPVI